MNFDSILDLGAGCGVVGLELGLRTGVSDVTLLEVQDDFIPYLETNSKLIPGTQIIHSSFAEWIPPRTFGCIVSNPPYFNPSRGERSLDPRRDMARSFIRDNWKDFFSLIERCLPDDGKAFLVLRSDPLMIQQVQHCKPLSLEMVEHVEGKLIFLELSRLNVNRD